MRLSVFNIYVEDYPRSGETLIHNTLSGGYVILDTSDLAILRRADGGESLDEAERETVFDSDLWDPDVAICVESRDHEEAEFRGWFEGRRSDRTMNVIFGVNLACNFDCPYCCQAEVMDGTTMSHELCDQAADWIVGRAAEIDAESVTICFVGGEPLLHPGRIKRVASRIRAGLDVAVPFAFTLLTNGYFLDSDTVDDLVAFGLIGAQVTIDGDERTHHLTRVSKKGGNTFRRVFDHAVAASAKIRVSINGNYQADTLHGFGPLVDQLAAAGLRPGSKVSFSPALETLSSSSGVGSGSCTFSGSDMQFQPAFHDAILRAGFVSNELHAVGPCSYHDRHSYAIDPDGTILKCPGFMGRRDWGIGHVASGLNVRYRQLLDINPQRECTGCTHRPNCGGGCVAAQWLELGRPEGVNCEQTYFESVARDGVIRGFLLETEEDAADAAARFPEAGDLPREPAARVGVRPASLRVVA